MASSVEEFIIQLGFSDAEAIKGYKSFLTKLNKLNKNVVDSINSTKAAVSEASVAQQKADANTNRILSQQLELRDRIIQGKQLGLDTSKEERTLSLAKKYETLRSRTLEIEESISKEKLKQATLAKQGISTELKVEVPHSSIEAEIKKVKSLLKLNLDVGVSPEDLRKLASQSVKIFEAQFQKEKESLSTVVDVKLDAEYTKFKDKLKTLFSTFNTLDVNVKGDCDKIKAELNNIKESFDVLYTRLYVDSSDAYKALHEFKNKLDNVKVSPTLDTKGLIDSFNRLSFSEKSFKIEADLKHDDFNAKLRGLSDKVKDIVVCLKLDKDDAKEDFYKLKEYFSKVTTELNLDSQEFKNKLNQLESYVSNKEVKLKVGVNKSFFSAQVRELSSQINTIRAKIDLDSSQIRDVKSSLLKVKSVVDVDTSTLRKVYDDKKAIDLMFKLPSYTKLRKDIKDLINKLPDSKTNIDVTIAKGSRGDLNKEIKSLAERLSKYKINLGVKLDSTSYKEIKEKLKGINVKTSILSTASDLKQLEVLSLKLKSMHDMAKKPVVKKVEVENVPPVEVDLDDDKFKRAITSLRNLITRAIKLDLDVTDYQKKLDKLDNLDDVIKVRREVEEVISVSDYKDAINKKQGKGNIDPYDTSYAAMVKATIDNNALDEKLRLKTLEKETNLKKKAQDDAIDRQIRFEDKIRTFKDSAAFRRIREQRPEQAGIFDSRFENIAERSGTVGLSKEELRSLNREFGDLKSLIKINGEELGRFKRSMIGLQTIQYGLRDSTRNLIRSYASMFALFAGGAAINRTGQEFQGMRAGMMAVSDDSKELEENLSFVREESQRLGLNLVQTSKDFVKLYAAAQGRVSDEDIKKSFTGIVEAATVFQLTMDDTTGTIRAVQQMFSKEGIKAEEFKNQLGDRIPIAMRALEKSTGKTASELLKMMELGQLGSEYIAPFAKALGEMAKEGGALEAAMKSGRVQQARFITGAQIAADVIYSSGFEEGISNLFSTMTSQLESSRSGLEGLGKIFRWFFDTVALGVKIVTPVLDSFFFVTGQVFGAISAFNDMIGNNVVSSLVLVTASLLGLTKLLKGFPAIAKYVPFLGKAFKDVDADTLKTTKSISLLGTAIRMAFTGWGAIIIGIIAVLDELFSLFSKGRVGLLEKYLFGEDLDFDKIKSKVLGFLDSTSEYFGNTFTKIRQWINSLTFEDLTSNLGKTLAEALAYFGENNPFAKLIKGEDLLGTEVLDSIKAKIGNLVSEIIMEFSTIASSLVESFNSINWGQVFGNIGLTFKRILTDVVFGIVSFFAGFIESMVQRIPTMGDFNLTDDINKARNDLHGMYDIQEQRLNPATAQEDSYDSITPYGEMYFRKSMLGVPNTEVAPVTPSTEVAPATTPPVSNLSTINDNTSSYVRNSTNTSNTNTKSVNNTVSVTYNDNGVSNPSGNEDVAKAIGEEVRRVMDEQFTDADKSNGGL